MGAVEANPTTSCHLQNIPRVVSAHYRRPSLNLLEGTCEAREKYLNLCVPLHKAALKGDWRLANHILEQDGALLNAAITKGWETVLHVAAGANHVHFVDELVKMMHKEDLELQDYKGNTAFCFAAAVGNVRIVDIMWNKNQFLPTIRGGEGVTALHMAALQGRSEMAWYLYPKTIGVFQERDWVILFFVCINTGIYDLALELLAKMPTLALARYDNETGLHVLARKPSGSGCQCPGYRKQLMNCCK